MAKHRKKVFGRCAYCDEDYGQSHPLTIDHVIPVCLFPQGKAPSDAPIVYACKSCNGSKKNQDDSFLQQLLVMDDEAYNHPIARNIFDGPVTRAITAKDYMYSPIAQMVLRNQGRTVSLMSPGGIYLGEGFSPDIPLERIHRIFSTIVRGLSLFYTRKDIPKGTQYDVIRARGNKKPVAEAARWLIANGGIHQKVGDGQVFECLYGVAQDRPEASVWILEFYRSIVVVVTTGIPILPAPKRSSAFDSH